MSPDPAQIANGVARRRARHAIEAMDRVLSVLDPAVGDLETRDQIAKWIRQAQAAADELAAARYDLDEALDDAVSAALVGNATPPAPPDEPARARPRPRGALT